MSNNNSVRVTGLAGLIVNNLAVVFGGFFIATKAPDYVAYFHGVTPEMIVAGLFNWLLCQMALSNGGWNFLRVEVTVVAITLAAVITGIDVYVVHNVLL